MIVIGTNQAAAMKPMPNVNRPTRARVIQFRIAAAV